MSSNDRNNAPSESRVGREKDKEDPDHDREMSAPKSMSKAKSRGKKRDTSNVFRKAPGAPKRFKSSYIFFFTDCQARLKKELGPKASVADVSRRSAQLWRNLPTEERAHWDEVAAQDKERYLAQKDAYTGPWHVPAKKTKKNPEAPKRPMSAFLYFSQDHRGAIKLKQPNILNTEVSRILGDMWRSLTEEEKRPYREHEAKVREKYKEDIALWRKEQARKEEEERKVKEAETKILIKQRRQQQEAQAASSHVYPGSEWATSWNGAHASSGDIPGSQRHYESVTNAEYQFSQESENPNHAGSRYDRQMHSQSSNYRYANDPTYHNQVPHPHHLYGERHRYADGIGSASAMTEEPQPTPQYPPSYHYPPEPAVLPEPGSRDPSRAYGSRSDYGHSNPLYGRSHDGSPSNAAPYSNDPWSNRRQDHQRADGEHRFPYQHEAYSQAGAYHPPSTQSYHGGPEGPAPDNYQRQPQSRSNLPYRTDNTYPYDTSSGNERSQHFHR